MAKEIYENGVFAQGCAIGTPSNCSYYLRAVVMPGYPFLIDILFKLFGVHDIYSMIINGIVGSLNIILIFILYYIIFNDEQGALITSLIYCTIPGDIYISHTAAVRPLFLFFILLAFISYFLFIKENSLKSGIFSFLSLSYAIYIRPEGYLVFAIFLIGFLLYFKKSKFKSNWKYIILILLIFIAHQYASLKWLSENSYGMTGGSKSTFSIHNSILMIPILLKAFFIRDHYIEFNIFNPFISILFFISIFYIFVYIFRRKTNKKISFSYLFGLFYFL